MDGHSENAILPQAKELYLDNRESFKTERPILPSRCSRKQVMMVTVQAQCLRIAQNFEN